MIGKKELVISNLYRYFYALSKIEELELELERLDTSMGVKSPKFDSSPSGYSGTHDEKLLNYSIKKQKLDDELKGWKVDSQTYYNVLRLFELEENDIKFLTLMYKDKLSGDEIANKMYFTNRMYVSRKKDALLEKLSKYVWNITRNEIVYLGVVRVIV